MTKAQVAKKLPCRQQELSRQDQTTRSPQDGPVLPRSVPWHCQVASDDFIIISSDEESDTDEGSGVNDTLQGAQPHESHSSITGSDASGEWEESYYGRTDG